MRLLGNQEKTQKTEWQGIYRMRIEKMASMAKHSHNCYSIFMSKQLSPQERFTLVQRVHSASYKGNPNRVSVEQACRDMGIAASTYHRWKKLWKGNSDGVANRQISMQSTAPKRNGMSLSDELQKRIADMARSGLYKNPRQIAKALQSEGIKVSDNAVRNNLEKVGLYGLETVTGSNGDPIKKKVILPS